MLGMNYTKDRRLWWALSLNCLIGVIGMALSVIGFDRSGLILEALAILMAVGGVAMTVVDVVRSPDIREKGSTTKHP